MGRTVRNALLHELRSQILADQSTEQLDERRENRRHALGGRGRAVRARALLYPLEADLRPGPESNDAERRVIRPGVHQGAREQGIGSVDAHPAREIAEHTLTRPRGGRRQGVGRAGGFSLATEQSASQITGGLGVR